MIPSSKLKIKTRALRINSCMIRSFTRQPLGAAVAQREEKGSLFSRVQPGLVCFFLHLGERLSGWLLRTLQAPDKSYPQIVFLKISF